MSVRSRPLVVGDVSLSRALHDRGMAQYNTHILLYGAEGRVTEFRRFCPGISGP